MNELVDLRTATPDDLESLFDLYATMFRSHIEDIWGWDEAWQRSHFERDMESTFTSVVEVAGKTVGYMQTVTRSEHLYLRNIALHPDAQGRGIGTRLVKELQEKSRGLGVPVELSVFRTNPRAQEFYGRLGFQRAGKTDTHIDMSWHPPR